MDWKSVICAVEARGSPRVTTPQPSSIKPVKDSIQSSENLQVAIRMDSRRFAV